MIPLHTNSTKQFKSVVLTAFLLFLFIGFSQGQVTPTDWKINTPTSAKARSNTTFKALPEEAVKASISIADFKRKLQNAPQEIVIPTPAGNFETFLIKPTNVVAEEVAHLYTIKTFSGYKKDDPSVLIACDISDYGFHAGVYDGKQTYFVEPASSDISAVEQHYIYFKQQSKAGKVKCGVTSNTRSIQQAINATGRNIPNTKRTYRLGIIASGEYGQQFGGTPFNATNVLNALASGVNLINPIYLRDLGVEFSLVSTAAMVYANPITDPFDLNDQSDIVDQSHDLCVAALGVNGFDIGHTVVWENLGGLASTGVVCDNLKGEGFSGADGSVTTLWVDYVAHEIGHQFGAEHNFSAEECQASVAGFRFEPGEGSSIMAYANVCQASVRYTSSADPYFHYASIKTMQDYIATTNCAITSNLGNSDDPVAFAQSNITIPKQTPFVLVGNATDANDLASNLTYNWLQYDGNGAATTGAPDCNSTTAPLFRYRPPVDVSIRSFPQYADVIAGNNNATTWERLPCTARTMNFSLTVRDNNPSFGRVAEDRMVVTVADTGPFVVTSPNGGETFMGNTSSIINWSVNETNTHCPNVDILLSIDGGATYAVVANATPNDGTQIVTIPNNASSTARILIRCDVTGGFREASTFYDVSNANFTILEGIAIVDNDNDGFGADVDCNDNNANINPNAIEVCDGIDNDCDGLIDAADPSVSGVTVYYADSDKDGFGDPNISVVSCNQPTDFVLNNSDCNDNDASVHPDALEICNGKDDDCDGLIDEADPSINGIPTWYADNDNDGFGNINMVVVSCIQPTGFVDNALDCNDNNATINPDATEIINNNVDEDCDGTAQVIDIDNDGHNSDVDCNDNNATIGAQQLPGVSCDDGNANTINDVILADGCSCAGTIPNPIVDNDNDGFSSTVDCDDNNPNINPGATEIPNNNVDEDCNGTALIIDNDNDGFNSDVDCNDNNPAIGARQTPGTACNDGNANTTNDVILADGCSCAGILINTNVDNDNDGFTADVDCDDFNATINPAATEFPNNNVDENCDGIILFIDNDNDGQNSSVDCDDNNPNIGPIQAVGTACDDGNPNTVNDVILAGGCDCAGTIFNPNACINRGGDADNDGICADIDCNDNNAAIGARQTPGTACDDGNANTTNDVIISNGCDCAGIIINIDVDNDNDGFTADVDCDDFNATINPAATEFPNNNVDENCDGIILIIDNDNDGQNSSVDCDDNNPNIGPIQAVGTACDDGNPNTVNDVIQAGGCMCAGTFFNPNACINNGGDADMDGICADIDCNDNNAAIGARQTPGTACNDGNSNTANDVILADGCSCAGTIINTNTDNDNDGFTSDVDCDDNNATINPGATEFPNNNVDENCDGIILVIDNDNDGQNSSVDCDDNNPNIGPKQAVGTACDDGNPNTHNDVILADGCTCSGAVINPNVDNDNDGFNSDVDCNDNNAAINPAVIEIPDNGIDENCDGVDGMTTMSTCDVPTGIHAEGLAARKIFITWNALESAISYTVQVRFKGSNYWLVTTDVLWNKVSIFGPSGRDYEYRVRANCNGVSSAYSEILEFSNTGAFSESASSRNADDFVADIIIRDEVAESIQLTPNPVREALTLQYTTINKATVAIYHTSGQLIRRKTISNDNYAHPIDVSDLEAGLYLLTIEENGKLPITKRFIKIN